MLGSEILVITNYPLKKGWKDEKMEMTKSKKQSACGGTNKFQISNFKSQSVHGGSNKILNSKFH